MAKHRRPYQSPFAPLLTDQRFAFATQLAQQAGIDPSQVLFAYLQLMATVATNGQTATVSQQQEIDRRFQQFLDDAAE